MKKASVVINEGKFKFPEPFEINSLVNIKSSNLKGLIIEYSGIFPKDLKVLVFLTSGTQTPCIIYENPDNLEHWTGTITITNAV